MSSVTKAQVQALTQALRAAYLLGAHTAVSYLKHLLSDRQGLLISKGTLQDQHQPS